MLTHQQIWLAVDRLAASSGYSVSGLAKVSGLDPTAFNKSKRTGPEGKLRWPSTESISRILNATGATMMEFTSLVENDAITIHKNKIFMIELDKAQKNNEDIFDAKGLPTGKNWQETELPQITMGDNTAYALKISGTAVEPFYRNDDILIISPKSSIQKGDRVIFNSYEGQIYIMQIVDKNETQIELKNLDNKQDNITIPTKNISSIARIIWASQ